MKRFTAIVTATALLMSALVPARVGDQLARMLGVDGDRCSNAERTQLLEAVRDDSRSLRAFDCLASDAANEPSSGRVAAERRIQRDRCD